MAKRSVSSARGKRAAKSGRRIPDERIDFSDIPDDRRSARARPAGRQTAARPCRTRVDRDPYRLRRVELIARGGNAGGNRLSDAHSSAAREAREATRVNEGEGRGTRNATAHFLRASIDVSAPRGGSLERAIAAGRLLQREDRPRPAQSLELVFAARLERRPDPSSRSCVVPGDQHFARAGERGNARRRVNRQLRAPGRRRSRLRRCGCRGGAEPESATDVTSSKPHWPPAPARRTARGIRRRAWPSRDRDNGRSPREF